MATAAYEQWDAAGRHWHPAKPIAELEAWVARNGFINLGTLGNDEHLFDPRPKDHTPFSVQAWPDPLPGYIVCAIDIEDDRDLGAALLLGAQAGHFLWLKYLNVGQKSYHCRDGFQSWEFNSDTHNHLSIRTDWIDRTIGDFDPLGELDMFDETDRTLLHSIAGRTLAEAQGTDATAWAGMPGGQQEDMWDVRTLKKIAADVESLKSGNIVDVAALAEALRPHIQTAAEEAVRKALGDLKQAN